MTASNFITSATASRKHINKAIPIQVKIAQISGAEKKRLPRANRIPRMIRQPITAKARLAASRQKAFRPISLTSLAQM